VETSRGNEITVKDDIEMTAQNCAAKIRLRNCSQDSHGAFDDKELGEPKVEGMDAVGDKRVPGLYFGLTRS
jgi:hypothetical protein